MRNAIPRLIWVFLGLLGVSMFALSLGQTDREVNPSAFSTGPSGTAALVELLRRQGYEVKVDRREKPELRPNDLVISLWVQEEEFQFSAEDKRKVLDRVFASVDDGTNAIFLQIPGNFLTSSSAAYLATPVEVREVRGDRTFQMKTATAELPFPLGGEDREGEYFPSVSVLTFSPENSMAVVRQKKKGRFLQVTDASFVTNRLIDQAQNADVVMMLVRGLARNGGRIVFTEGTIGQTSPVGLLESIGAWADAAWRQLIFLGFVIIATLGRRFGLPEADRRKVGASRELVTALSDTLARGRNARLALTVEVEQAEWIIRRELRLARNAEIELRSERLPHDLRVALAEAKSAILADRLAPAGAIQYIKRLHAALSAAGYRREAERRTVK